MSSTEVDKPQFRMARKNIDELVVIEPGATRSMIPGTLVTVRDGVHCKRLLDSWME
jgi:hypothetical protein